MMQCQSWLRALIAAVGALAISAVISIPQGNAAAADIKIGFLLKTMQEERYQLDKTLFIAKAESLGAEVIFDSSNNDELTQLQQFEALLETDVDVIVLQPVNTGTAGSLVSKANKQGIKVVGYDSMLTNGPLDVMVMQDSWAVGKLQGEAMLEWFQETAGELKGRVALIMGQPGDSNAAAMSEGILEVVANNPGLELVEQRSHADWSPDAARETAENLLVRYDDDVDAFVCNNSGLASGVVGALDAEGPANSEKVFVAGADADLQNLRYIAQGKQTVEIWKKIKPLAYKAAEIAVQLAQNPDSAVTDLVEEFRLVDNGFAKIPTVITPVVLVTKDNIDSTVIEEDFFTREQIYGK